MKFISPYLHNLIPQTLYMVLPSFATRFALYAGGIQVSFTQPQSEMVYMGYMLYGLIWMKFISMLSMYVQSGGDTGIFIEDLSKF